METNSQDKDAYIVEGARYEGREIHVNLKHTREWMDAVAFISPFPSRKRNGCYMTQSSDPERGMEATEFR